jgi:DnaJ-class molecular chaperone
MYIPKTYICDSCKGAGGYDATTDCEIYDDWQVCEICEGTGEVDGE